MTNHPVPKAPRRPLTDEQIQRLAALLRPHMPMLRAMRAERAACERKPAA